MIPTIQEIQAASSQVLPHRPSIAIWLTRNQSDLYDKSTKKVHDIGGEKYRYYPSLGALVRVDAVRWIKDMRRTDIRKRA